MSIFEMLAQEHEDQSFCGITEGIDWSEAAGRANASKPLESVREESEAEVEEGAVGELSERGEKGREGGRLASACVASDTEEAARLPLT